MSFVFLSPCHISYDIICFTLFIFQANTVCEGVTGRISALKQQGDTLKVRPGLYFSMINGWVSIPNRMMRTAFDGYV